MVITWPLREPVARALAILRDSRPNLLQHLAAAGCVAVVLMLRGSLDPILGDRQPLSLFFGAVALTVWLSGYRPALTAAVLGYLGADYFFTEPRREIAILGAQQLIGLIIYSISCVIVIAFGESLRRASERARRYAEQMELQRAELERADHAKDEFLATLSHELRNPVMCVSYVTHLLQRKTAVCPELQEASRLLGIQMQHLTRLVDDLLDLARIRTGQIHLRKDEVSMNEILTAVADSMRSQADGRLLLCNVPEKPLIVCGDFARLSQVFINLLSNAFRYTPAGGTITVRLGEEGRFAVARVRDTGIGIPQDKLERIFDLFEQTDTALACSKSGLGIGLALVRKLLHLHGGSVKACSEGPNTGSEFIVRLPLRG